MVVYWYGFNTENKLYRSVVVVNEYGVVTVFHLHGDDLAQLNDHAK